MILESKDVYMEGRSFKIDALFGSLFINGNAISCGPLSESIYFILIILPGVPYNSFKMSDVIIMAALRSLKGGVGNLFLLSAISIIDLLFNSIISYPGLNFASLAGLLGKTLVITALPSMYITSSPAVPSTVSC